MFKKIVKPYDFKWLTNEIEILDKVSDDKINIMIKQAIFMNIYNNGSFKNWYINFFEYTVSYDESNKKEQEQAYIKFANDVRNRIYTELTNQNVNNIDKSKIIYTTTRNGEDITSTIKKVDYRVYYMSPNVTSNNLSISLNEKDIILKSILELHFKNKLLSHNGSSVINAFAINEDYYIHCYFKLLNKKKGIGVLHCLKPNIKLIDNKLKIELRSVSFLAKDLKINPGIVAEKSLNKVPDITFNDAGNNYKVIDFADARKYYVNHILLDFDQFKGTKLGNYINCMETMSKVFEGLNIKINRLLSHPQEVFTELFTVDVLNEKEELYIAIEKSDYLYLSQSNLNLMDGKGIIKYANEIEIIESQIKAIFPSITTKIYIFEGKPILKSNELYLTITLKNKKEDHYIYDKENVLNNESAKKIYFSGNNKYSDLDWYTQQKIEILKENERGSNEFITQGLVLNKDEPLFYDDKTKVEINKNNLIKKVVYELTIKKLLFKNRGFDVINNNYKNIKVLKRFVVKIKTGNIVERYGYLNAFIKNNRLIIDESKLLDSIDYNKIINKYQLKNLERKNCYSSTFFIIDDEFIIKKKNNELNPIPVLSFNATINSNLNPYVTVFRTLTKDKKDGTGKIIKQGGVLTNNLSKTITNEHFLNYNLPNLRKMTGDNSLKADSYCLIEFKNKEVNYFCTEKNSLNLSVDSINRMESLSLYKEQDFEMEKIDFNLNRDVLEFYLSLTTDNLININSYSKVTLLEKMLDVLWDN